MTYPATPASLERTKARQYSETVPAPTGFGAFPLPTDAGARMAEIWPEPEAEEVETPRSIAELSQDHHEQHKEMEADDDRAGFDPF